MGCDIYLKWDGMTKEDEENQICGYDITYGKFGYLRGAYNGHIGLDAIKQLFDGIPEDKDWIVDIKILKKNLEKLEKGIFKTKKSEFYSKEGKDLEIQSYRDFVALAEKLNKQGKNPTVHSSY